MQHVPEITHIIDTGNFNKAHEALDKLLEMGPKNVEALKLKCLLLAHQGRFTEEARLWEKIIDIDPEDEEAITHFQRRYFDERESFYFTDLLADGGRRFVSHPRALITASFMGLFGCILFLILPSLVRSYNFLANPTISISCFAVLVAMPWLLIIYTYLTGLREIVLTSEGIALSTRLRSISMKWLEVEDLVVDRHAELGIEQEHPDQADEDRREVVAAERAAQPLKRGQRGEIGLARDGVLRAGAQQDRRVGAQSAERFLPP